jgi:hypothetical protein
MIVCALAAVGAPSAAVHGSDALERIQLEVRPKVCTLAAEDEYCRATVRAHWRSTQNEALCLVIVGQPHVQRCWENHSEGRHTVELAFSTDLTVELRDSDLERVLAAQTISVIREALQLRRKRRQPWDIFF